MTKIINKMKPANWILAVTALAVVMIGCGTPTSWAAEETPTVAEPADHSSMATGLAFISAALSVGAACIGAGMAVSAVGSAALGAVAERPELMGRSLIYVGLAEGIAIYGLIVSIIILGKV